MTTTSEVLKILEKNRATAVSGEWIAQELAISRTAVWKAIKALQEDGYIILATKNRGYQLDSGSDVLSAEGIKVFLNEGHQSYPIFVCKSIPSTNSEALKRAVDGASHGTVILSDEQTAGRGRSGKTFFSPANTGIYMSIVLCPEMRRANAYLITILAAVAVCKTIEKLTGKEPKIKWVNDVLLDGKKVCGILTEMVGDFESAMVDKVIVGIGMNVRTANTQFPQELRSIAASLFPENVTRNQIVAEIINELMHSYARFDSAAFVEEYKKRSLILGKTIQYTRNGSPCSGLVVDISPSGNLVVRDDTGGTYTLPSGEKK